MACVLVSVCDRDILVESFSSIGAAHREMMQDLGTEFFRSDIAWRYDEWMPEDIAKEIEREFGEEVKPEDVWNAICQKERFCTADYAPDDCLFSFYPTGGWSNLNEEFPYDWKIQEI